jgi:hypothetical protein
MELLAAGGAHYELRAGGELVEYLAQRVLHGSRTTGLDSREIYVRCVDRHNDTLSSHRPDRRTDRVTAVES